MTDNINQALRRRPQMTLSFDEGPDEEWLSNIDNQKTYTFQTGWDLVHAAWQLATESSHTSYFAGTIGAAILLFQIRDWTFNDVTASQANDTIAGEWPGWRKLTEIANSAKHRELGKEGSRRRLSAYMLLGDDHTVWAQMTPDEGQPPSMIDVSEVVCGAFAFWHGYFRRLHPKELIRRPLDISSLVDPEYRVTSVFDARGRTRLIDKEEDLSRWSLEDLHGGTSEYRKTIDYICGEMDCLGTAEREQMPFGISAYRRSYERLRSEADRRRSSLAPP